MSNEVGVVFNGRRIVHPGAYDATNTQGTVMVSPGSANTPILIGTAQAGQAGVVKWYNDLSQIREEYKSGDLVTGAELLFSPVPEGGGGASVVGILLVNDTKQAKVTKGGLVISSKEFGEGGNKVQAKLEDGTMTGTKKFTVYRWDTEELQVLDNLGAVLNIRYTGPMAYASVAIATNTLTTKVGTAQAGATVDVALDLTSDRFKTAEDVVKHLNSLSGYTASLVDYSRNFDLAASKLDTVAEKPIKENTTLLAVKGDLELQIAKFSTMAEVTTSATALTNFDFSYLTGGAFGTVPTSWSAHFNTIKGHFSDILVVLSDSESVQAEALAHIQQMEARNQKQMLFTGGGVGESVAQVKQRAAALNSSRAVVAYPGIYHKSVDGGKKALPAYMTAATIAGRVCGVDQSEPITFDYFNLIGLERELLAGSPEVDDLLSSGVATLEKVQNGAIRLVQGITTYRGSNNAIFREISVRRGADKVSNIMRNTMENTFIGRKGISATASAVQTTAINVLEQAIREADITAYQNIVVRFVGTLVYVDYEVAQVEPINFVLITSHFVPDSTLSNLASE